MTSRKLSGITVLAIALCVFAGARIANAGSIDFYLKITGAQQGVFKGEGAGGNTGQIPAAQFRYQSAGPRDASSGMAAGREAASGKATGAAVQAPRDSSTGVMTGKRMHSSITITKEMGMASPMLAKAMSTNEVLTSVDLEFVHAGPSGAPEVYKTMHLTNAMVSSIRPISGNGGSKLEEITFTADPQSIEAKAKGGKTMAMDDWMVKN